MLQRFFIYLFYKAENIRKRVGVVVALVALALVLIVFASSTWFDLAYYELVDHDPDRGAEIVKDDPMGDRVDKIAYLDQNWTAADSIWFYSIPQGSDLLPYDFFLALEQPDSQELFRSDKSMNFRPRSMTTS